MAHFFHTYLPTHSLLRKHISYFYIDRTDNEHYYNKYSFFPHTKTTLSFYRHAVVEQLNGETHITCTEGAPTVKLLTRQHSTRTVVQQGKVEKLGIVFFPLGLNHFIQQSYSELAPAELQPFNPREKALWDDMVAQCFSLEDLTESIPLLESFFLSVYRKHSYEALNGAIQDLSDPDHLLSIKEVALKNRFHPRALNRHFRSHLSISPELFRMIARFRYVVDQRVLHDNKDSYTRLAYEGGFLDQSYMIKTFRKLTGLTPAAFFREGKHIGQADTWWQFHQKE
ncbi:AraC family transcriptional regulator [Paraflavitalea soli]|uniref:AraC family transcriptional regulator n=1 Tax=Paraflavitalea soli TaxID=2315862 RepID=A0A3B7MJT6_9BACT|nr:AraC family transcriptional regulator [Paraflavitalea soli]AXY73509.1 AraC family transcriptional regulator [Paraflavitalea soli]